ncbi:hypothetical protein Tco_1145762 [Tanacetum coccineum]
MTKPDTEWKSCKRQGQSKAKDQISQSQSQLNKSTVKTKAERMPSTCLKKPFRWRIRERSNGTDFVNQTLREYYGEEVDTLMTTSVARERPQQNRVVEREAKS